MTRQIYCKHSINTVNFLALSRMSNVRWRASEHPLNRWLWHYHPCRIPRLSTGCRPSIHRRTGLHQYMWRCLGHFPIHSSMDRRTHLYRAESKCLAHASGRLSIHRCIYFHHRIHKFHDHPAKARKKRAEDTEWQRRSVVSLYDLT